MGRWGPFGVDRLETDPTLGRVKPLIDFDVGLKPCEYFIKPVLTDWILLRQPSTHTGSMIFKSNEIKYILNIWANHIPSRPQHLAPHTGIYDRGVADAGCQQAVVHHHGKKPDEDPADRCVEKHTVKVTTPWAEPYISYFKPFPKKVARLELFKRRWVMFCCGCIQATWDHCRHFRCRSRSAFIRRICS